MGYRGTTLLNNGASIIEREIGSKYDVVKLVSEHLAAIEELAQEDIVGLIDAVNEAKDFTGITVVSGSVASWNPTTKVLAVPTLKGDKGDKGDTGLTGATGAQGVTGSKGLKGDQGVKGDAGVDGYNGSAGLNGMTATYKFVVDGDGDLAYEFVEYVDINSGSSVNSSVQEW